MLLLLACSDPSDSTTKDTALPTASALLTAADGGEVLLPDGSGVRFDAGALSQDATITVAEVVPPAAFPDVTAATTTAYEYSIDPPEATFTAATWRMLLPTGEGWGTIFHYIPELGEWADLGGADQGDGYIEQVVAHFSIGGPAMLRATAPLPPAPPPADPPPPIPTPSMVSISGGSFYMGSELGWDSERPVHPVHVDAFDIGKYEVTNAEFVSFLRWEGNAGWVDLGDDGCHIVANGASFDVEAGFENYPVACVSPDGAIAFANWLSEADDLDSAYVGGVVDVTKDGYRLPTEAEWEYVATLGRGDEWPFAWGTAAFANQENTGQAQAGTRPVGSYASSGWWGLYDLGGNVTEYCSDWFEYNTYTEAAATNPVGPASSSLGMRAIRGPNWYTETTGDGYYLRVAARNGQYPDGGADTYGFRLARSR